jgi:DNA processing protein
MAKGGARRAVRIPTHTEAEAELAAIAKAGGRMVAVGEAEYPRTLAQMDQPPPLLSVLGAAAVFDQPSISIVGARNASLVGMKMARQLSADLGRHGWSIVSGLARGIDTAAHQGSMRTGTVAVLAGGLNRPYPPENVPMLHEIVDSGGAVVSEMPFDWEPRAQDFPRRNRIIAGLSLGLLVVEAAQRSGSLISARLAGEIGRVVFAVPGSPLDPRASGTNGLLKQGAVLVTDAQDVLEHMAPMIGAAIQLPERFEEPVDFDAAPALQDEDRQRVLEALGPAPTSVDELIRYTGIHPANVFMILLELDLAGRLERQSGGTVSLLPDL